MIEWLRQNFPTGINYLVRQDDKEQINSFLMELLVAPFQKGRKHNLWGEVAERLPLIGKKLGWVPNKIPGTFLTDTVEGEIADAVAAADSHLQPLVSHFEKSRNLLQRFKLLYLSQQHPLSLSQGETKLIWFLSQWVKKPEYLIIGHLPSGISSQRIKDMVNFLNRECNSSICYPIIILGFQPGYTEWCNKLISHQEWKVVSDWPEY